MATINYWGLTGVKRSVTVTLTTATVDTLITAMATDEGLSADYYAWSLLSDPNKNSIVYGDSSTKLSAMGLVDGDTVLCTPQQNESKQERQVRKLTIAQAKRKAFGDNTAVYYRTANNLDITLLPDTYNGNEPGADDNANTGGLVEGRPWTSAVSIRSFLSGSGQTAYDAASSGAWFAVSSTDWDAAVAGISGATKKLVTDGQMTEASGAAFSSAYIITQAQAAATITAGNYIFALRGNTAYSNQSWTIYGGTTYKSLAYSAVVSGTPATASTGTYYYLRKAPTALASTTYIGIVGSQNLTMTSSSTFAGAAFIASPYNTGSWGNWSGVQPKVQVVITSSPVA